MQKIKFFLTILIFGTLLGITSIIKTQTRIIEKKIIKICDYLELKNKTFDGFISWVLDLRKKLEIPHKLSEVIKEKDLQLDRLSKMALEDPSTGSNPKELTEADMKLMYQHSMSGTLFND